MEYTNMGLKLGDKPILKACLLGLLGLVPCCIILLYVQSTMVISEINQKFGENTYQVMDVYDEEGNVKLKSIKDLAVVDQFRQGVANAGDSHGPGHTIPSHSWYISIAGTAHYEIELSIYPNRPNTVYGRFVSKSGNSTSYYDAISSNALRPWVDEHLIKETANKEIQGDLD